MKTVDKLGIVKAQIADLIEQENTLKKILTDQGPGEYNGDFFRATVTESERAQLDVDAARRALGPVWVKKHTSYIDIVTVRVNARIREAQEKINELQA